MEILKEILDRRSIRKYKSTPVTRDQILELLEAGRLAPSGNNTQPWRFMIITDQAKREEIIEVDGRQTWMKTAPVLIAVLADITCRVKEGYEPLTEENSSDALKRIIRDSSNCIENLLLQATKMGLGSCWTGDYEQIPMRAVLDISENYYVAGIVTLGYADEAPAMRPRKKLEDLILKEI